VALAPLILVDDIGERNTADWPEPAHWVADRQQCMRVDAGRQSKSGLGFFLELQIQRGQCRPEAKRSRHKQQYSAQRDDFSWGFGFALAVVISVAGEL
jgi:hypothetical protein